MPCRVTTLGKHSHKEVREMRTKGATWHTSSDVCAIYTIIHHEVIDALCTTAMLLWYSYTSNYALSSATIDNLAKYGCVLLNAYLVGMDFI